MEGVLVLLTSLLSLTLAADNAFFLSPGVPYVEGGENFLPHSAPVRKQTSQFVPLPVHVRFGVPGLTKVQPTTAEGLAESAYSFFYRSGRAQAIEDTNKRPFVPSNELVNLTPAGTILSHDLGSETSLHRNRRQVFGSPVWDRKVIDTLKENCQPLPVIGGAVAGASGGPVGVALGVTGALIGACNFNG